MVGKILRGLFLGSVAILVGCGGSSAPISVAVSPASQALDQAQTATFSATVANDSNSSGVTWAVSGGGTLSGSTATDVTYNAPATVSAATTATLTATSVKDTTKTGSVTITVNPPPTITTSAALPNATAGVAFSATLTSSGGTAPFTWTVSAGTLPTGLTLSSAGVLSGTVTAIGTSTFTVQVTDSGSPAVSATEQLTFVVVPAPLVLTPPSSLAGAIQNAAYTSAAFSASGGTGTINWSATGLPAGLHLSAATGSSIAITGTPTAAGTSTIVVTATDSGPGTSLQTQSTSALSLTVVSQLQTSSPASFPSGVANRVYGQGTTNVDASGGTPPYTWTLTGLPAGIACSSCTTTAGVSLQIGGTPTTAGTSTVSFSVKDSGAGALQQTATGSFAFTVIPQLQVTTTTLPTGLINHAYAGATLASTGGTAPITWAAVGLPAGLSLNASTGAISGTPTTTTGSPFSVVVTATDSGALGTTQQTAHSTLSLSVMPLLAISTTTLPNGSVNTAYTATLASTGGIAPIAWSVTLGSLPAGLALNATTGAITGTPTASGASSFTVTATDSASPAEAVSQALSITVTAAPLQIVTTTLPGGTVNAAYSTTLSSSGGTGAITWSETGLLPAGLSLNATTGVISGTPTAQGTANFTVMATDSGTPQQTKTQALSITVNPSSPLAILTTTLPSGTSGNAYSAAIGVGGGVTPYSQTIISGALPAGLSISACSSSCGGAFQITGTPTANGTFNFTLQVTDSESPAVSKTQAYSLVIAAPTALAIQTTSLSNGTVNNSYSGAIGVSGGVTPYTRTIVSGALPAGLTLSTGACNGCGGYFSLTGTPTASGTFNFTIQVTDSETPAVSKTQAYTLVINAQTPLAITNTTLSPSTGTATDFYAASIYVTGGTTPYTGVISSGSLPPGLNILSCNGGGAFFCINGTPSTAGTYTFTVKVTDSEASPVSVTRAYTLTINPAFALTIQTTSLPNGTQNSGYSAGIGVAGGATPYTQQVVSGAVPTGLSIGNCTGNMMCNGYFVLSGTPTAAGTFNFTVKVTDGTSGTPQTATQAYTVVIAPPTPLSIQTTTLGGGTVGFPYNNTLQANGGAQPYTWSATSGLPSWATLNATTGAISGTPPTGSAATASVVVKVTDSTSGTPQTATATLSLAIVAAGPNNSELNGSYALRLGGFNNGNATGAVYGVATIGNFIADGNGNITSAVFDINQSCTGCTPSFFEEALTGNYSIGADNRGIIVFRGSHGGLAGTYSVAVGSVTGGVAQHMRMIEFDDSDPNSPQLSVTSGEAKLQTASAFALSTIKGNFVFGFQGESPCNSCGTSGAAVTPYGPVSAVGLFTADGNGHITSGQEDAAAENTTYTGITLAGSVTAPSTITGKGTIVLTPTGTIYPAAPANYIYYVVSASEIYMMSMDSHAAFTLLSGDALLQQQATFSNSSLNGKSIGYEIDGKNGDGSSFYPNQSQAQLVLLSANGSGQVTVSQDRNSAGTIKTGTLGTITYSVAANGRMTVAAGGGSPVFYLINNNQAFATETPSSGNGHPGLLSVEPQSAGPFSATTLSGAYTVGDVLPVVSTSTSSGVVTITNGSGTVTQDNSDPSGALTTGQQQTFTLTLDPNVTGRATLAFPGGGSGAVLYIISPNKAVVIDLSTSDTTPTVTVVEK